jgi:tetratricopeptide (TPR) repeat protein
MRVAFYWLLATGFWLLLLSPGCVDPNVQKAQQAVGSYMMGDNAKARELLRPISEKPDENFVLNNARLGSAALIDYRLDEAEGAFVRAYEVVNSVGVNNGGRSLGAALVDEKIKIWKGEPFERAMLNFYLGLIYYMRQDYPNARGAFENAMFKLRDYDQNAAKESDKYNAVDSNFALGFYMLGKTWQRLGRDDFAKANFDRVKQLRPDLANLPDFNWNRDSNLLLVVDYGVGPRKVTNDDGAIVGFAPLPSDVGPMPEAQVTLDGRRAQLGGAPEPLVDLLVLAQDRKWQSIDTIRAVKSALGTGMIVGGLVAAGSSRNRDVQAAGWARQRSGCC